MYDLGAGVPDERRAAEGVLAAVAQLGEGIPSRVTDEADLSSPVLAEGLAALEPERRAYQRVVADLGVGIERQVVPGQRDVGVEQDPQSLPHGRRDRAGMEVPQQTVMGYHQLRALISRPENSSR